MLKSKEMDLAKQIRREIQTNNRQITQKTLANSEPVREDYSKHPVSSRELAVRMRAPHPRTNLSPAVAPSLVAPRPSSAPNPAPIYKTTVTPVAMPVQPAPAPSPIQPTPAPVQLSPVQPAPAPINPSVALPVQTQNIAETSQLTPKKMPLPAIDMDLPGEESPSTFKAMLDGAKVKSARRWAFRGMVVGLVLFITMGGLLMSQTVINANKMFRGSAGTASALNGMNPDMLKGESSGRINILLLGRGGGAHTAPDLTDTIMLASVDPINHKATILSLPRDMWVTVPSKGPMKLNASWQTGRNDYQKRFGVQANNPKAMDAGFELLNKTVEEIIGMNIDYNLIVNFQAFKQAIDTVGGVSVNVPSDLVDPTMAWENANNPVLAKAGPQIFDGKHALIYVRSRETTSDFARSERQRAMMLALKDKISSAGIMSNPKKISDLIKTFGDNVYSDLSVKDATRLYSITQKISDMDIKTIGLTDPANPLLNTGNIIGQSVVLPKKGLFKYGDIQNFLKTQMISPYVLREKARIMVLNGGGVEGLAGAKAEALTKAGYNVVGTANLPDTNYTQTVLVSLNGKNKPFTKKLLEKSLKTTAKSSMPDNSIPTNSADFVIILGSNETITPKAQTN